ncbi:MAG TPA: hypothetical protein VII83_01895 [Gaiellaceae bacterium]
MEFELEWVDPSLVICRTSGLASVDGYETMMQALVSDPQFRPGVDVITDRTNVDVSALTAADIERLADIRARATGAAAGRSAMVVGPGSPMRYGLGRMFGAYFDTQSGADIAVFETVEKAIAWLRGTDSLAP